MPQKIILGVMIISLMIMPQTVFSQPDSGTRPKIGYVFSGGGARGMANLGVLKVLEEVGLEPDYITTTSMGGIMGGLYAIGYSADEISHIIETVDWSEMLTKQIPSNQVLMRRKHEYSRYLLEMPVYNGKPELPSDLIEGQKLSELFSELAWRQAGVDNFHEFPYPFTCIGTDILEGKTVEMNSGDLSSAMRASMAIPSVFTAVIRDSSHILVDGGVMRNFPVQEAIDMGADIIIGVYVGFDSHMKPEQLSSPASVITRTSILSGARDVESQLALVDYLIVPDLSTYSASGFDSALEIMNRGEEAARAQIDVLRAFADSINSLGAAPTRRLLPANDSLLIADIKVENTSASMEDFILDKSELEVGSWIHPDQLNESIARLFGTLFFKKIEYYFEDMDQGKRLVFRIKEKAPASLGVALHYDNAFGPGLILNYTHRNLLGEGTLLGLTANISANPQLRGYYDIHLGKKRNFIASAFVNAEQEKLPFFTNNEAIGSYTQSLVAGGLGFRQTMGFNHHIGADFYYRSARLELSNNIKELISILEYLDKFVFRGPEVAFVYQHNSYDNNLYPTRGVRANIIYRQAFRTNYISSYNFPDSLDREDEALKIMDPYWHLLANFESYFPLGKKISFNSEFAVGLSANDKPFPDKYYIGGFGDNLRNMQVSFVGMQSHELLHGNYVKEKFAIQFQPFPKLFVSLLYNLVFVSDDISGFLDDIITWNDDARYMGAGAGFTYRTPIGPVSVFFGSRTDIWNPMWYTNIGFAF